MWVWFIDATKCWETVSCFDFVYGAAFFFYKNEPHFPQNIWNSHNEKQVFFSFLRWINYKTKEWTDGKEMQAAAGSRSGFFIVCPYLAGLACWFPCEICSNKAAICQSGSCVCSAEDPHSVIRFRSHCQRKFISGQTWQVYIWISWQPRLCHSVINFGQFMFSWISPKAAQALMILMLIKQPT